MVACANRTLKTVLFSLTVALLGCSPSHGGASNNGALAAAMQAAAIGSSSAARAQANAGSSTAGAAQASTALATSTSSKKKVPTPKSPSPPPAPSAATASIDFDVEVPSWTPAGQIWVAVDIQLGTLPAWSANGWGLAQNSSGRWVGSMAVPPGAVVHAKITRGTWSTVEKGPVLEELADRTLVAGSGHTPTYLHVYHWADDRIPNTSGDLDDLGTFAPTNGLLGRRVVAHLPPGYDDPANSGVRYPVLYALDGQNLFDPNQSFSGVAWGLDTASDNNVFRGRGAFICIAIDNTSDRINEYTPSFDSSEGAGGKLELLATWLFSELKPAIDALYRTSPTADDTGLMGSSLGGLASLNIGWKHSDQVHRIAALSPSLWWNNQDTLALIKATATKPPLTIWLDIGTDEGSDPQTTVNETESVLNALQGLGFVQTRDLAYEEQAGAQHTESAWASRLPDVVSFLFP